MFQFGLQLLRSTQTVSSELESRMNILEYWPYRTSRVSEYLVRDRAWWNGNGGIEYGGMEW